MKKIIFGLIATVFSFISYSQSNSKNEFDYVGRLHNELVDTYLKNNYSYKTNDELCKQINDIASKNKNFISMVGSNNYQFDAKIIDNGIIDFKNYFKNTINSQPLSEIGKQNSQKLVNYLFEKSFSKNNVTYKELFDYIVNYEDDILKNTNLSKLDKQILLSSSSVARYSLFFWDNHFNKNSSSQTTSSEGRSWWQWVVIGVCDVGGAIAGAAVNPGVAVTAGSAASTAAYTMTNPKTK